MNWGDELCGVKVTPESWAGGVVEAMDGDWVVLRAAPYNCFYLYNENEDERYAPLAITHGCVPIFPPKGWAGKTDAELCGLLFGAGWDGYPLMWTLRALDNEGLKVGVDPGGVLSISICNGYKIGEHEVVSTLRDPAPLILALQNAQVLARRLQ